MERNSQTQTHIQTQIQKKHKDKHKYKYKDKYQDKYVVAKGPGPGRDGVHGAEQAATTSAEAKVHPGSPLGGGAKSEL